MNNATELQSSLRTLLYIGLGAGLLLFVVVMLSRRV